MSEERVFLSEGDLYVSNTRVILRNTTYATANITSVRGHMTPAQNGCGIAMIVVGALMGLVWLPMLFTDQAAGGLTMVGFAGFLFLLGIVAYRAAKPTYHVYLASAGGERQGYSSQDEALVNRITHAITNAIVSRG